MKSISSIPGALVFRSISVILIVSILVLVFLPYSFLLSDKAALIERTKVIQELNVALTFRLYQATIEGLLDELAGFDGQNPFSLLQGENYEIPASYVGEVKLPGGLTKSGWYFDLSSGSIFFWDENKISEKYRLQFIYLDVNQSGRYEAGVDVIQSLGMMKI